MGSDADQKLGPDFQTRLFVPLGRDREVEVKFTTRRLVEMGRDTHVELREPTLSEAVTAFRHLQECDLSKMVSSDFGGFDSVTRDCREERIENGPSPATAEVSTASLNSPAVPGPIWEAEASEAILKGGRK